MFLKRILDSEKDSSIKIIGIGDVGCIVVNKLYESGCKYHTIAINPDMRDAIGIPDTKLIVGINSNNGLGCRANQQLAQKCFDESIKELDSIIRDNSNDISGKNRAKKYILVGSLSSTCFFVGIKYLIDIINKIGDSKIYVVSSDSSDFEGDIRKILREKCISMINDYKQNNYLEEVKIVNSHERNNNIDYYDILNNKMINEIFLLAVNKNQKA